MFIAMLLKSPLWQPLCQNSNGFRDT